MPHAARASHPMEHGCVEVDSLVVGGGIAGLFALRALEARGASALLVERSALGDGQTAHCQGILHAGTKYALSGVISGAASAADAQVACWSRMLAGGEEPDLSSCTVRATNCHLWRPPGLVAAASLAAAKLALSVRPHAVARDSLPAVLRECPGEVLELGECAVDPLDALRALAAPCTDRLVHAEVDALRDGAEGVEARLRISGSGAILRVRARNAILAAGEGNGTLRSLAGLATDAMQLRPLRQGYLRGDLPLLFGHCIDGARTRITVTSRPLGEGRVGWSVGGEVAERGATMGEADFCRFLAEEVRACLPGLRLDGCECRGAVISRAEGAAGMKRPDGPTIRAEGHIVTLWPTKFVLARAAAEAAADRALPCTEDRGRADARAPRPWPSASPPLAPHPWASEAGWERVA